MVSPAQPSPELRNEATHTKRFVTNVTLAKFGPIQFSASKQPPNPTAAQNITNVAMEHILKYGFD